MEDFLRDYGYALEDLESRRHLPQGMAAVFARIPAGGGIAVWTSPSP